VSPAAVVTCESPAPASPNSKFLRRSQLLSAITVKSPFYACELAGIIDWNRCRPDFQSKRPGRFSIIERGKQPIEQLRN
jgi:hypothetical protein